MNKNVIYKIINIFFLIAAAVLFGTSIWRNWDVLGEMVQLPRFLEAALWFSLLFVLLHMVKIFRLYLILLEEKVGFKRFLKIYIKTTFVNIILPLKSGELFRFYCYGRETQNYRIGLLSILVERFFDTCALLLLLIPINIVTMQEISGLGKLLLFFVAVFLLLYLLWPSVYTYMNRFFIFNVYSRKSIGGLRFLEGIQQWFTDAKRLVSGRAGFIFGLSLLSWGIEFVMFTGLCLLLRNSFLLSDFSGYITAAFLGRFDEIQMFHNIGGSLLLGIILGGVYLFGIKKGVVHEK